MTIVLSKNRERWYYYEKKKKQQMVKTISIIVLLIGAVIMLVPFFWMISTSLKNVADVFKYPPSFFGSEINGAIMQMYLMQLISWEC